MRTRRIAAWLSLAGWACAVLLAPLHLAAPRGHRHDGGVTIWDALLSEPPPADDLEAHHARFDADLAALDLSEAAHFGIAQVDCSLAEYTLVDCESGVPHGFGDETIAHRHHHGAPFDPRHGAGALEHLAAAFTKRAPLAVPQPALALCAREVPLPELPPAEAPRLTLRARGPPLAPASSI